MKIVITGGAGFIGSNTARRLVEDGHVVKIVDNLKNGSLHTIQDIYKLITFIKGDVRNETLMRRVCKGFDAIIHAAAMTSVPESMKQPMQCIAHNVIGTSVVLSAALRSAMQMVVFASSCSVYGNTPSPHAIKEEQALCPMSPYAYTKMIGENLCSLFTDVYGLPTAVLRYFNVYGPTQRATGGYASVIPTFITKFLNRKKPIVYGTGSQSRDFVYIDDVVEANVRALQAPRRAWGKPINIGAGQAVSINRLLTAIEQRLARQKSAYNASYIRKPRRTGDILYSRADIRKAKKLLHYVPSVSIALGLDRTINWAKNTYDKTNL